MVFYIAIGLVYAAAAVIGLVLLLDDGKKVAPSVALALVWPVWAAPYLWKRMQRPAPGSEPDDLSG